MNNFSGNHVPTERCTLIYQSSNQIQDPEDAHDMTDTASNNSNQGVLTVFLVQTPIK